MKRDRSTPQLELAWTDHALRDLDAITDFIAADDVVAAVQWVDDLVGAMEPARDTPHMGRQVPELGREDIREFIRGAYRIVYRIAPGRIEVLTVFEGHRQLRDLPVR